MVDLVTQGSLHRLSEFNEFSFFNVIGSTYEEALLLSLGAMSGLWQRAPCINLAPTRSSNAATTI
jgi:hypothetical protein